MTVMTGEGKYRVRTWLRRRLPYPLLWLAPKGSDDCGNHQWYRRDDGYADCYHCEVGERRLMPGQTIADLNRCDDEARVASGLEVPA